MKWDLSEETLVYTMRRLGIERMVKFLDSVPMAQQYIPDDILQRLCFSSLPDQSIIEYSQLYPEVPDKYGNTLLMEACSSNRTKLVEYILSSERKASYLNASNSAGRTALHKAIDKNNDTIILLLLNAGVQYLAGYFMDDVPFIIMAGRNMSVPLRWCLDHMDPNDIILGTPIVSILLKAKIFTQDMIDKMHPNLDQLDSAGNHPLSYCTSIDMVKLLMANGINLQYHKNLPLIIHFGSNINDLRFLLKNGANPNYQDNRGDTMLMILARRMTDGIGAAAMAGGTAPQDANSLDRIRVLAEYGASPFIQNNNGDTIFDIINRMNPKIANQIRNALLPMPMPHMSRH